MAIPKRLKPIEHIKVRKISSKDVQLLISTLIDKVFSPKTIRNTYGILKAALSFAGSDQVLRVHLPSTAKKPRHSPEAEQIEELYRSASDKMKIAIALAAFHSLRRGEIASLKFKDLDGNKLSIHSDMVWGVDHKWHYKEVPKTEASKRIAYLPPALIELISTGAPNNYILGIKPNSIGKNFDTLKKKLGIDIRFHDLRYYFASLAVVLNVPDTYTASLGGWKNDNPVLKKVYQGNIQSMTEIYAKKINEHYERIAKKNRKID